MAAAYGIDHQLDAMTVCHFLQDRQPVLVAIVDRMIQSALSQELMLGRTCRAIGYGIQSLRNIERSQTDSTAGIVNQHGFTRLQRTHHRKQRIGSQVVDRNRGALFKAERLRLLKHLRALNSYQLRLAFKAGHRHN